MQKYIVFIGVFTILQCYVAAAPTPVSEEDDYLTEFIEKHFFGLNIFKGEIEEVLSEILGLSDTNVETVKDDLQIFKENMSMANDDCAKKVLQLFKDDTVEPDCPSVDDLIQAAGKILTTTTDILTGSIHSFYIIFADKATCEKFHGFKCFLVKFHRAQSTVFDVIDKLINYKNTAVQLVQVYKDYFGRCKKPTDKVQQYMQFYSTS
uniref:Putative secreted protein n=1 Tax=Panstrongylus lignarius TaxID=156445 RepID=A0A224XY51_9HEMI